MSVNVPRPYRVIALKNGTFSVRYYKENGKQTTRRFKTEKAAVNFDARLRENYSRAKEQGRTEIAQAMIKAGVTPVKSGSRMPELKNKPRRIKTEGDGTSSQSWLKLCWELAKMIAKSPDDEMLQRASRAISNLASAAKTHIDWAAIEAALEKEKAFRQEYLSALQHGTGLQQPSDSRTGTPAN